MNKYLLILLFFSSLVSFSNAATFSGFRNIISDEEVTTYPSSPDSPDKVVVFSSIIDWSEQKIIVSTKTKIDLSSENAGQEIKNTYTVLKSLALKKAVETIDTINIDSNNNFMTIKLKKADFSSKFNTFISGIQFFELDKSFKETGILKCTLSVPLSGTDSLTQFVADNYLETYFNFTFPDLLCQTLYAAEETGIIIDARDINLSPALLPKVSTEKKDVYNPKNVPKKDLKENGAVQYAVVGSKVNADVIKKEASKQDLSALKRTGANPVVVKAYKSSGTLQTDAIISEKDAKLIQNSKALKEGKVTIIVDSRVGGIIGKNIGENEILVLNIGATK